MKTGQDIPGWIGQVARLYVALASSTRISILLLLLDQEDIDVVTIVNVLEQKYAIALEQPSISHHLRILREAALIEFRRDGQRHSYRCRDRQQCITLTHNAPLCTETHAS